MKKIILSFIFVIGSIVGFSQSLYEYTDLSNYRVKVGELVLNGQKMRPITPLVNQVLMYDGLRWKNQNEKDLIFAADSANIVKYVGNDRDLDMGANSINTDTVKIDGVPLLLNTFKKGNLGGAGNLFYSTGASSQPASGSVTDVIGNNYIKNQNTTAQPANVWINGLLTATQLISTIPTGTAPLTVVSTTKVDNLNVEMLDGKHASDFELANVNIQNHIENDEDSVVGNEIQDLSRAGNTLSLSGDATTVDLSDLVTPDLSGYATTTQLANQLSQTISNGITTKAPSEDAVYDALTGKATVSGNVGYLPKITGTNTLGNSNLIDYGSYMNSSVQINAPIFYAGSTSYNEGWIEIRSSHVGNNFAYIDFTGDQTYTDYGLRIIRDNTGADANGALLYRGKGDLLIFAQDAGRVILGTKNTRALIIDTLQNVGIGTTTPAARIHSQSTGTQLRLGYDATKYTDLSTNSAGNLTIDPSGDNLSIAKKTGINETGGVMVKLTNKTGANSVKGTVVYVDPSVDNAFGVNPINGDMPFGVVYESGITDGSECWVVVSGIAEVLLVNTIASTRSHIAYSSGSVAGRIDIAASVPAADDVHFREIGHTLESKAGGTDILCKCVIHFN